MVAPSDPRVRIIGFGSLLSKASALRSFPTLESWSLIRLPKIVRLFGHAAPVFFERGMATVAPPYAFASLCAEPSSSSSAEIMRPRPTPALGASADFRVSDDDAQAALARGDFIYATAFTIPKCDMEGFYRREVEFALVEVQPWHRQKDEADGDVAVMCGRGSDALLKERLGSEAAWEELVGRHGLQGLWDHGCDIRPASLYLRLCVLAAGEFGGAVRENFLKTTFLGDRLTSVGEYLDKRPEVMATEPTGDLRKFYRL